MESKIDPIVRINWPYSEWVFSALLGQEGAKRHPPSNLLHIFYNDKTGHSYILPKEDQKNIYESLYTPPEICWH